MHIANPEREAAHLAFARRAAEAMMQNPKLYTFTDEEVEPGALLAVRWNPFTILVLQLAEDHTPTLYPTHAAGMIHSDLPPLVGDPQPQPNPTHNESH